MEPALNWSAAVCEAARSRLEDSTISEMAVSVEDVLAGLKRIQCLNWVDGVPKVSRG